ncbi:unnamed protein product [Gongylonema pulchrum]|uniref:Uncharacterized protein n=1 Tax=Gongylonema pulchrum TaxID=637853 RepID=A0A183E1Z6_9BILA|nr:unnamed protein product [Gongylonema pulchrum]
MGKFCCKRRTTASSENLIFLLHYHLQSCVKVRARAHSKDYGFLRQLLDSSSMGGHHREQSDSHVPLRQCVEFHRCVPSDSRGQIRIPVEAGATSNDIELAIANGTINSTSSDLPINHIDCFAGQRQRRVCFDWFLVRLLAEMGTERLQSSDKAVGVEVEAESRSC